MRWTAMWLLAVFTPALSGCGSFLNLWPCPGSLKMKPSPAPNRVYGGVELDAAAAANWFTEPFRHEWRDEGPPMNRVVGSATAFAYGTFALALDLPLSGVVDTLTLPITVPAALRGQTAGSPFKTLFQPAAPVPDEGRPIATPEELLGELDRLPLEALPHSTATAPHPAPDPPDQKTAPTNGT